MVRPRPASERMSMEPDECAQAGGHHVEADAAAGDLGDHVARGEAGQQREAGDLGVAWAWRRRSSRPRSTARLRMSRRLRPRPSSATCTVTTWPRRATVSVMRAGARLADALAFVRRLEAVVDRVAQDVQQRVDQLVQHVGVDEDVAGRRSRASACLCVAAAVWRTLRCRRGTMVSTGAMRVCEVRCCSSRIRRCCWCRMPARPASSSLRPTAEVARVGGFFDERARERLHFVVLVEFQRVEVAVLRLHGVQLVARGDAADVHRVLELEQALLDGAVAFDQFARMAGGGLQFLVELADLDRELAHHAHEVVEQLRWARASWPRALRACRAQRRPTGVGVGRRRRFQHALAHRIEAIVVARARRAFR